MDYRGFTPLCYAGNLGLAKVAVALMDAGANIDFVPITTLPGWQAGFTPLIHATLENRAGVVQMLLKRGADGTKGTTQIEGGPHTALDVARNLFDAGRAGSVETLAVLRLRCCSTCGARAYTRPHVSST